MNKKKALPECKNCEAGLKSVFCNFNLQELTELNLSKGFNKYKKGQIICHQGGPAYGLFHIYNGKIKISVAGVDGKEQIIDFLYKGDIFGYLSVFSDENYLITATAIEDSEVCFIPKKTFLNLITRNANLSLEIMKLLSQEVKQIYKGFTEMAQKPVRERMADALLFLKQTYGFESGSKYINIKLSREEIANMVGTSRETATRLLSEFNEEKMIYLDGKKISLLDERKLIETAKSLD
jgi:CRP/FNR family transcriptional regulator